MAEPATTPRPSSSELAVFLIDGLRAYERATAAKHYSTAQRILAELCDAVRQLPSWAATPTIEPASEVTIDIPDGRIVINDVDETGQIAMLVEDKERVDVAVSMSPEIAGQVRLGIARVLAMRIGADR